MSKTEHNLSLAQRELLQKAVRSVRHGKEGLVLHTTGERLVARALQRRNLAKVVYGSVWTLLIPTEAGCALADVLTKDL